MRLEQYRRGDWTYTWQVDALGHGNDLDSGIDQWISAASDPARIQRILKEDHRTQARLINGADDTPVVFKRDLRKCRDPWIRFCTWFRDSEALGHLKGLAALSEHAIAAPQPLLVAERRRYGMVVDAWLLYRYRDGVAVPTARNSDICHLLQRLHDAGFWHRDVHTGNFLLDGDTVFIIDFKLRRNRLGAIARAYDWTCLERRRNSGIDVSRTLPIDRNTLSWRLASIWFYWKWPAHRRNRNARGSNRTSP